jgi:hypothetical protein
MHSTDLEEIKAALWEQASHPCTQVRWEASPGDGGEKKPWAIAGTASRAGALVSCGSRDH